MRKTKANTTHFLLKRNVFIGVIVFLVVFFILPFWGMSHIPNMKESILRNTRPEYQAQNLRELVSSNVMFSQSQEAMVVLFGGLGFLTAMMLMRHLFSRRQGMLQASLPDRRETEYGRRCIAYLVLCIGPIVLNYLLYLLIVAANGLLPYVDWGILLPRMGVLLAINFYGFAMGMVASVLTGTYWAALLAGAVLIIGLEGLAILWYYLAGEYLHTLVSSGLSDILEGNSPAFVLYRAYYAPSKWAWFPSLLSIVLALGLSFGLYRIRKTEMAERTLAFGWLHPLMGFALPVMGGSVMGLVMMMSFANEAGLFGGFILGAVLTYWVCRMVFNQRFCGILCQWYLPAAAALLLVAGAATLHLDIFGFDHFMPERERLTAISYQPQGHFTQEHITLTSDEALDAAYAWCTLMRDEVDGMENGINASNLADRASAVVVTYQFDGRTVQRYYPNGAVRNEAQPYLKTMIESNDYRQSLIDAYHLEDEHIESLYLNAGIDAMRDDTIYDKFNVTMAYTRLIAPEDSQTIARWLAALKADIEQNTFEEKAAGQLFNLQLHYTNPETNSTGYRSFYIYPGDTNFLTAVFGDKAEEIIAYGAGGFAAEEEVVALKLTYAMSRADMLTANLPEKDMVQSVEVADTPEKAVEWVKRAQNVNTHRYYFMPDYEDRSYSRLYLYNMSEVERYQNAYNYEIPADKSQFYTLPIPTSNTMNFIGE